MSFPSLSAIRGFGLERCCGSEPGVTKGPLVILTGPQSSEADMNHPAVGGKCQDVHFVQWPSPATQGYFPACGHKWEKEYLPNPVQHTQPCDHVCVDVQDILNDHILYDKFIAGNPGRNDARKEYFIQDKTFGNYSLMDDVLSANSTMRTVCYTQNCLLN